MTKNKTNNFDDKGAVIIYGWGRAANRGHTYQCKQIEGGMAFEGGKNVVHGCQARINFESPPVNNDRSPNLGGPNSGHIL